MTLPRTAAAFALALLAAAAFASLAAAAGSSHPSTVRFHDEFGTNGGTEFVAVGDVRSSTRRCLANRKLQIFFKAPSSRQFKQVDVARTSANGDWAGSGPLRQGVDQIKAVLLKSKYGPRSHRQTCGGDTRIIQLA